VLQRVNDFSLQPFDIRGEVATGRSKAVADPDFKGINRVEASVKHLVLQAKFDAMRHELVAPPRPRGGLSHLVAKW
jgi:hypothetical protein